MRMNNMPLTLNKDAIEVLQLAPGVQIFTMKGSWYDKVEVPANASSSCQDAV